MKLCHSANLILVFQFVKIWTYRTFICMHTWRSYNKLNKTHCCGREVKIKEERLWLRVQSRLQCPLKNQIYHSKPTSASRPLCITPWCPTCLLYLADDSMYSIIINTTYKLIISHFFKLEYYFIIKLMIIIIIRRPPTLIEFTPYWI